MAFISRLGVAQQPSSPPPASNMPVVTDGNLRNELLLRVRTDEAAREAFMLKRQVGGTIDSLDIARLTAVDTSNTAWLKRIVARQGWPTRAQVGSDGVRAALMLVEHADLDSAFQSQVLPLIQRSSAAGDLPGAEVAVLTDRVAVSHGRPQLYGTQAKLVNGRWVAAPIADSSSVDTRRTKVGLPPLRDYFRVLDSLATAPR
jgi:hypothetical protein